MTTVFSYFLNMFIVLQIKYKHNVFFLLMLLQLRAEKTTAEFWPASQGWEAEAADRSLVWFLENWQMIGLSEIDIVWLAALGRRPFF